MRSLQRDPLYLEFVHFYMIIYVHLYLSIYIPSKTLLYGLKYVFFTSIKRIILTSHYILTFRITNHINRHHMRKYTHRNYRSNTATNQNNRKLSLEHFTYQQGLHNSL